MKEKVCFNQYSKDDGTNINTRKPGKQGIARK